ncbi:MAG: hypothetical protein AAF512_15715 [Pseudomonadota bacterium]
MIICLIFLFLIFTISSHAEGFNPYEGPGPVTLLVDTDPSANLLGADNPRFVLY